MSVIRQLFTPGLKPFFHVLNTALKGRSSTCARTTATLPPMLGPQQPWKCY